MALKKMSLLALLFISMSLFSQNENINKKLLAINTLLQENEINKYYEQLNVSNGDLIFKNVGKDYLLKNSNKRVLTIDKILIKKIKAKTKKLAKGGFHTKIEFKTEGKNIYNEIFKGNYSNCYFFYNVKDKKTVEMIKNLIVELIVELKTSVIQ